MPIPPRSSPILPPALFSLGCHTDRAPPTYGIAGLTAEGRDPGRLTLILIFFYLEMTYAFSTHSSWAEVSLVATDGSNSVGERSPQPGKAGRKGHSGGSSKNCVRYCNPPHVAGMNLRSLKKKNSHFFGCLRSSLQHEESLLSQCDLLLWGTDSLLELGLQGMWAQ